MKYTALFFFCGLGGGARGFIDAQIHMFGRAHRFRSLGGIDNDPAACRDFQRLTRSPALCADIATMTSADLVAFTGRRAPDIVFGSPPCKGFSSLLSKAKAKEPKYQRLNKLALDWIRLMLTAWPEEPPRLILFENVPRITSRGATLLRKAKRLLRKAGYKFQEGYHDCGEIGGLAQHRKRYLLVARHPERVTPVLYEPPVRRVRGCGEVLGQLPMPEDPAAGPMHRMPRISWLNWVRLALIPAGGDWRDLPDALERVVPQQGNADLHHGKYKVRGWDKPTGTVIGASRVGSGAQSVADPRVQLEHQPRKGTMRVTPWDSPAGSVTGQSGRIGHCSVSSVADERVKGCFHGAYKVIPWGEPVGAVTSKVTPSNGTAVADPRVRTAFDRGYSVLLWSEPSPTVAGGSHVGQGAYSVADIRIGCEPRAGAYGVISWQEAAKTVIGCARVDNGAWAVADPRVPDEPVMVITNVRRAPPLVPVIIAEDGTWHRPLTTLELAALQGLPTELDGKPLVLDGKSVTAWRERIGNAVPEPAARAIAEQMLACLTAADTGAMQLPGLTSVWVKENGVELVLQEAP
jgi:site-specific DNA-cytosine methylase